MAAFQKNFPKQFIKIQQNHSIFQETIARNLPYCDEFIIITNYDYHFIINQMEAFYGIPYRCVYEEEPRKATTAITLVCLSLQISEYVFAVAADHLIDTSTDAVEEESGQKTIRCKFFETSIISGPQEIHLTDDSLYALICIGGDRELKLAET